MRKNKIDVIQHGLSKLEWHVLTIHFNRLFWFFDNTCHSSVLKPCYIICILFFLIFFSIYVLLETTTTNLITLEIILTHEIGCYNVVMQLTIIRTSHIIGASLNLFVRVCVFVFVCSSTDLKILKICFYRQQRD